MFTLKTIPTPVYPLLAVLGFAVGGATFFVGHLARHPDNVWAKKSNPHPALTVKQNETTKLYNPYGSFERTWSRGGF
ncbi:hypothetical protein BC831DRAFT_455123 [Entophlyctis helioformis]|nr:hypothetical protein BC831DRAFT_455123 [Entophlyctis helioformis]